MKSLLASQDGDLRTFVLILETGEDGFAEISKFAAQRNLHGASVSAVGAFQGARVGWFDPDARSYRQISVDQQVEVLSLIGDIATGDDQKPSLHVHVVLGLRDGSTRGGHLMEGIVRPTLEVMVIETALHLRRRRRPELGVALIDLPA